MTVTEAKDLFEWLEDNGYGEFNIAVNNARPNPYILTIGKYTLFEIYEKVNKKETII